MAIEQRMKKTLSLLAPLSMAALLLFCLPQCAPAELENQTLSLNDIEVLASGPLFMGSNTAQGSCRPQLEDWMKEKGLQPSQIRDVRLESATVQLPDTGLAVPLESISLLFAADELDMQTLGVLNPVPENQNPVQINVAEVQKTMIGWLEQEEFTAVLDCGLGEDLMDDLRLTLDLEFSLIVKK